MAEGKIPQVRTDMQVDEIKRIIDKTLETSYQVMLAIVGTHNKVAAMQGILEAGWPRLHRLDQVRIRAICEGKEAKDEAG